MLTMDVFPSADLSSTCERALTIVASTKERVTFVFNGTPVDVSPNSNDSVQSLVARWESDAAKRREPKPKPPIGLMPMKFWEARVRRIRTVNIVDAMVRYGDAKKEIPLAWVLELSTLVNADISPTVESFDQEGN